MGLDGNTVSPGFNPGDYRARRRERYKTMTVGADEFVRRSPSAGGDTSRRFALSSRVGQVVPSRPRRGAVGLAALVPGDGVAGAERN